MTHSSFFRIKDRLREVAKLTEWDKAYLKIVYTGKGENEVFNDMDAYSYNQLDKMLTDFTEKTLIEYLMS